MNGGRFRGALFVAVFAAVLPFCLQGVAIAAGTPPQICEAGKNDAAGKFGACRAKADKSLILSGNAEGYAFSRQKCESKLLSTWERLEGKAVAAGSACPSEDDGAAVGTFLDICLDGLNQALSTGIRPIDLTSCRAERTACEALPPSRLLSTGQTTCWDASSTAIPPPVVSCMGAKQDGGYRKGMVRSYNDHGNGTIVDTRTGLMWEKLDDSNLPGAAGIHDHDNFYADPLSKIQQLNAMGFAQHTDWRLPNLRELETLVDYGRADAGIVTAMHNVGCVPGCVSNTCSCTYVDMEWAYPSSTRAEGDYAIFWAVEFRRGTTQLAESNDDWPLPVRAVRGGL